MVSFCLVRVKVCWVLKNMFLQIRNFPLHIQLDLPPPRAPGGWLGKPPVITSETNHIYLRLGNPKRNLHFPRVASWGDRSNTSRFLHPSSREHRKWKYDGYCNQRAIVADDPEPKIPAAHSHGHIKGFLRHNDGLHHPLIWPNFLWAVAFWHLAGVGP